MYAKRRQELGRPCSLLRKQVSRSNRKRGRLTVGRESDQLIVLRGRESRPHGEGADGDTQLVKETFAGQAGSGNKCQPYYKE